ncbi:hypothetical protein ACN38_g4635 [Penicillium nordicum]|uniref:Uncharacterized protein n=1 Tax=Penicillium nordicum TaxID=229535 RepID=A0A0M9WH29_9EURO|nr:hypothetical protein ACN38_g4635 [Penicillium nordicum]
MHVLQFQRPRGESVLQAARRCAGASYIRNYLKLIPGDEQPGGRPFTATMSCSSDGIIKMSPPRLVQHATADNHRKRWL